MATESADRLGKILVEGGAQKDIKDLVNYHKPIHCFPNMMYKCISKI